MIAFAFGPWLLVASAVVVIVVLAGLFLKTGSKLVLLVMGAVIVLVGGSILIERLIVTDEEVLVANLEQLCIAIESGELDKVLKHIHPDAIGVRDDARAYLGQFTFHYITITSMREIIVDSDATPPKAKMQFIFRVDLTRNSSGNRFNPVGGIVLHLTKEGDRWLVTAYERRFGADMYKKLKAD